MKRKVCTVILLALLTALMLVGCTRIENPVEAPNTETEFKAMQCDEALKALKSAGFTNIKETEQETDSENRVGKVISVSIDGDGNYRKGRTYESDVPVEVSYYVLSEAAQQKIAEEAAEAAELEKQFDVALEQKIAEEAAEAAELEKQFDVVLDMQTSGEPGKPVFAFDTNLPDGATLQIDVITDDDFYFLYHEDLTVLNGKAETAPVTNDGGELNGVYSVGVVLFANEQTEEVRTVIGESGQYMTGDRVVEQDTFRYIVCSFEYVYVPYENAVEQIRAAMREGFGDDFALDYNEESIVVETWGDGLAANAVLASLGSKENMDAWNDIVAVIEQACISVQTKILEKYGYDDVDFTVVVRNDANMENYLLVVTSGYVLYDAVNGIDLISALAG